MRTHPPSTAGTPMPLSETGARAKSRASRHAPSGTRPRLPVTGGTSSQTRSDRQPVQGTDWAVMRGFRPRRSRARYPITAGLRAVIKSFSRRWLQGRPGYSPAGQATRVVYLYIAALIANVLICRWESVPACGLARSYRLSSRSSTPGSAPATSSIFTRLRDPATSVTEPWPTPNAAATEASAAAVALPSTARSLTRTTRAPSCSPPTPGRADPGRTRTAIRTAPVCAPHAVPSASGSSRHHCPPAHSPGYPGCICPRSLEEPRQAMAAGIMCQ